MKYLLDTNVVSETSKKTPHPKLLAWLAGATLAQTAISAATVGELRRGIELVRDRARREPLEAWYEAHVRAVFAGRTLALDERVMEAWGERTASLSSQGRSIEPWDALVASSALVHGLVLVTRNTAHFEHFGIALLNPWMP